MPSVGAAGLLEPEEAHCRGAPNPSRPYSKNAPVSSVRIRRSGMTQAGLVLEEKKTELVVSFLTHHLVLEGMLA